MWSPVACIRLKGAAELVREGNEGVRVWFLICLMSHNKERSALEALRCETATQAQLQT